ncbi:hypothetical protein A7X67_00110 [Clostridium sp. W14A]|nr:hypothetical protein A7X67_00110 [Clostridium sp. W14A]
MDGKELIEKLTLETANILYLAGQPEDSVVGRLESVIELVGEAWGLPDAVNKSKEILAAEREAVRTEAMANPLLPREKILQCDDDGDSIMAILWALFDTSTRLEAQEKRECVLKTAHFMADYLGLEEWIEASDPPCEETLS